MSHGQLGLLSGLISVSRGDKWIGQNLTRHGSAGVEIWKCGDLKVWGQRDWYVS